MNWRRGMNLEIQKEEEKILFSYTYKKKKKLILSEKYSIYKYI